MTDPHDRARELASLSPGLKIGSTVKAPRRCANGDCLAIIKHDEDSPYCRTACQANAEEDASQKKLRALAFERDKGVCRFCSADTDKERAELEQMRQWLANPTSREHAHFAKNRLDFYRNQRGYLDAEIEGRKSLWEADHLKERARGGSNSIENIATACAPCHAQRTGDFSRIRKVARKPRGRFGR